MCIVKKITMLFIVITFGVTYPMKRSFEKDYFELDSADHCVTFKSLKGFPLTSLSKGRAWFAFLSAKDKAIVTHNIINHENKRLELLFNIVTKLPIDVETSVIKHLYSDNNEADKFASMPIQQACCYLGYLDIIHDKKNSYFARNCLQWGPFKPSVVCDFAQEITILSDETFFGASRDKKQLEAIARVVEAFPKPFSENHGGVNYQYYKPMSLKEIIQEDLRYLPFFLSAFITWALPFVDTCGVNEDNVHFNAVANKFNAEAMHAYQSTGSKQFLDACVALRDENIYCASSFIYMKAASWLSACIPLYDVLTEVDSRRAFLSNETIPKDAACVAVAFFSLLATNFIATQSVEQPTLGASCVTGLYLLARCAYNVAIKKHVKHGWVTYSELPALLQRRDICIV